MAIECLAVIPARGGSKGVPRKNVADIAGVPLVARAIVAARRARRVTRVVVSTDDAEIAHVARHFGAEVVQRPSDISGDTASSESAVLHALDWLRDTEGYAPALVMLVQCTSPLTTSDDLDGLIVALESQRADSAFLAVPFFHFLWTRALNGEASPIHHGGKKRKRRQDLEPQYLENGAAYVMRVTSFLETGERFCGRVTLHPVDEARCLEIDSPLDVAKAEAAARVLTQYDHRALLPQPVSCLIMDFDGVLTDDAVTLDQHGVESVRCSRSDGLGLALLKQHALPLLILSKEQNPVVSARARKLDVECRQGVDEKLTMLEAWAHERGLDLDHAVYIGNDVNDLACMRRVGCAVAPADAHPEVARAATIVLGERGGHGAVRALCDLILQTFRARTHPI